MSADKSSFIYKVSPQLYKEILEYSSESKMPINININDYYVDNCQHDDYCGRYLELTTLDDSYGYHIFTADTLFFRCKDWANSKGFIIESSYNKAVLKKKDHPNFIMLIIIAENERQCVFDICEYIYKFKMK